MTSTTLADPTLATNASRWGYLYFTTAGIRVVNGPHPRYKRESVGSFLSYYGWEMTVAPPSLQMRVGGVVFSYYGKKPHPRCKNESVGSFFLYYSWDMAVAPPSLQTRVGGAVLFIYELYEPYNDMMTPYNGPHYLPLLHTLTLHTS
jgi:hypothetical protein